MLFHWPSFPHPYNGIMASAGQVANRKTHSIGGKHIGGGVGGYYVTLSSRPPLSKGTECATFVA